MASILPSLNREDRALVACYRCIYALAREGRMRGTIGRRELLAALGGAATWPLAARAQATKVARIGYLHLAPASARSSQVEALRAGLRNLGYVEGKSIVIEFRWAESVEQLRDLAAELVRMNVDIIVAASSTMVEPARQATRTIPIVFYAHADPVGIGHVASLARPGGNATGLSTIRTDLAAKELSPCKYQPRSYPYAGHGDSTPSDLQCQGAR
jgi:hypothetical protein